MQLSNFVNDFYDSELALELEPAVLILSPVAFCISLRSGDSFPGKHKIDQMQ
jgi:hypothetical protein